MFSPVVKDTVRQARPANVFVKRKTEIPESTVKGCIVAAKKVDFRNNGCPVKRAGFLRNGFLRFVGKASYKIHTTAHH